MIFPAGSPTGLPLIIYKEFETTTLVRLLSVPYGSFDEHVSDGIRSFEGTYDPYDSDYITLVNRMNIQDQFERWQALCDQLPKMRSASEEDFKVKKGNSDYIDALHSILGLAPAQCIMVRRGTLTLTAEQESRMAEAGFGTRPKTTNTPPSAFVELSEQPRWRFVVDDYLDRQQSSSSLFELESAARDELAHQAFVLAARTNGSGDDAIIGLLKRRREHDKKSEVRMTVEDPTYRRNLNIQVNKMLKLARKGNRSFSRDCLSDPGKLQQHWADRLDITYYSCGDGSIDVKGTEVRCKKALFSGLFRTLHRFENLRIFRGLSSWELIYEGFEVNFGSRKLDTKLRQWFGCQALTTKPLSQS